MYDTLDKAARIDAPVMVLHGDSDEIVPFEMGREVFEAAPEPKRFYAESAAPATTTPTPSAAHPTWTRWGRSWPSRVPSHRRTGTMILRRPDVDVQISVNKSGAPRRRQARCSGGAPAEG